MSILLFLLLLLVDSNLGRLSKIVGHTMGDEVLGPYVIRFPQALLIVWVAVGIGLIQGTIVTTFLGALLALCGEETEIFPVSQSISDHLHQRDSTNPRTVTLAAKVMIPRTFVIRITGASTDVQRGEWNVSTFLSRPEMSMIGPTITSIPCHFQIFQFSE